MELNEFVSNFGQQFEETDTGNFSPSTEFRSVEEWDSLIAMAVIGMVDDVYHIKLTGNDIRDSKTIEDIFNIVKAKA